MAAVESKFEKKSVRVGLFGRDELQLDFELDSQGQMQGFKLKALGCPQMMELVRKLRSQLVGTLTELPIPQGNDHASILVRELLLRAQGKWTFPYEDVELCHCRAVSTQKVDDAIISGAHTPLSVSRRTSASTSCGACRGDVEKILKFRLVGTK